MDASPILEKEDQRGDDLQHQDDRAANRFHEQSRLAAGRATQLSPRSSDAKNSREHICLQAAYPILRFGADRPLYPKNSAASGTDRRLTFGNAAWNDSRLSKTPATISILLGM